VVTGQGGSGKTTLAHRLARTIGCPAICRDEIKEGMVHTHGPGFTAAAGDPLTRRTYPLFFDVLRLLLDGGVTVVAEATWQHQNWERGLSPLAS
jgi:predicted kinase